MVMVTIIRLIHKHQLQHQIYRRFVLFDESFFVALFFSFFLSLQQSQLWVRIKVSLETWNICKFNHSVVPFQIRIVFLSVLFRLLFFFFLILYCLLFTKSDSLWFWFWLQSQSDICVYIRIRSWIHFQISNLKNKKMQNANRVVNSLAHKFPYKTKNR